MLGDPITVTGPLGKQTVYSYNGNGTVASMTDGNGHTTRYGYDAYGDTIAITDALLRIPALREPRRAYAAPPLWRRRCR
jgi:YD repeat-containing protein